MNFFKNKIIEENIINPNEEKSIFTIEYYPWAANYYALLNNKILYVNFYTGIIEFAPCGMSTFRSECKTKEEAENRIKLYKEQQFKENVQRFIID